MKSIKRLALLSLYLLTFMHGIDAKNLPIQETQDEVAKVDQLIKATEASLTRLKDLKTLLMQYKQAEVTAVKDPSDTDNLLTLVNLADDIQTIITDAALQDYFSPQFLEELKKFAKISEKKNIPQAK